MNFTATYNTAFVKRLRKNKGALFGIVIIILSILTAVLAYVLAPDNSTNANRIIAEVGAQKPGYNVQLLRIKKQFRAADKNFLITWFSGAEDSYTYIPISSYKIINDTIIYEKMIDEGITETQRIAAKLAADKPVISFTYYLGADKFGRDILSRLIIGVRVSLSVGLIAVLISLTIGIFLGAIAGYFKGRADDIIMWLINVIWSIPTLLLVFAVTLLLGKGFWQVFIAVGLTMWVNVARLVRGQVMAVKQLEYIEAAKALGFSHTRIIVKHILPNIMGPVMVIAASNFASAIVIEAGLSFLGIGVQPPQPSWGLMIKENYNFIITQNPMLALAPGLAIMLVVLAFNLLGNGLRDALNVKD